MQFEMDGFKDKNVETYDDRSVDGGGIGDITMSVIGVADITTSGTGGVAVTTNGLTGGTVGISGITTSMTGVGNITTGVADNAKDMVLGQLPRRQLPRQTTAQVDNCPGKTTAQVGQLPR